MKSICGHITCDYCGSIASSQVLDTHISTCWPDAGECIPQRYDVCDDCEAEVTALVDHDRKIVSLNNF